MTVTQVQAPAPDAAPRRSIRPRRGLPNGRAVVGGFLVAAAAVGVFTAYTSATAPPPTRYAVAARDIAVGEQLTAQDVRLVAVALPEEQRRRSYDDVAPLLGTVVVEPLLAGELLQEGGLVASGTAPGSRSVSFAVDPARAADASLGAGDQVDVYATFGTGGEACTHQVARHVRIVHIASGDSAAVGHAGGTTVTVEVDAPSVGGAVAHAAAAGTITLVRTTQSGAADVDAICTPVTDPEADG